MLNNKVIFLMWLYCVLSRHLALCNKLSLQDEYKRWRQNLPLGHNTEPKKHNPRPPGDLWQQRLRAFQNINAIINCDKCYERKCFKSQ
ncbi:Ribosomal Biogenesis Protein Las1L [Manis pentadactyla]|nr:Ribosomal Biogenesis Protein Las1L [Manis pentadactyla]